LETIHDDAASMFRSGSHVRDSGNWEALLEGDVYKSLWTKSALLNIEALTTASKLDEVGLGLAFKLSQD